MKLRLCKWNFLILIWFILLVFSLSSCSSLERTTTMTIKETSKWAKSEKIYVDEFNFKVGQDTIFIHPENRKEIELSFGPPYIPVIPNFLFWVRPKENLWVDIFYKCSNDCLIDLGNITFIYNDKKNISPYLVKSILYDTVSGGFSRWQEGDKYLYTWAKPSQISPDSLKVYTDSTKFFRFYFNIKAMKVKALDIYLSDVIINNEKNKIEVLRLTRKGQLEYTPYLMN